MNSKMKSNALMYAMMAMAEPMPFVERERVIKKDTSYLRKKCKSCKQFKGTFCFSKPYRRQQDVACEEYKHR